jgi:hypothetical protein
MGLSLTLSRLRKDYKLYVHAPGNGEKGGDGKEGKEGGVWVVGMHQDPQASSPSLAYQVCVYIDI